MNDDTDDEILLSPRKKHKMLLETPRISAPLSPLTPLPDTPYPSKGPTQRVTVPMPLSAPSFSSECDMDTRPDGTAVPVVVAVPDPPPDSEPPTTLNPMPPIVNTASAPPPTAPPVLPVKGMSRPTHGRSQSQSKLPRPSMGPPAPKIASTSTSTSNQHPDPGLSGNSSNGNSNAKLTSTLAARPKPAPKIASIFTDTKAKADAAAAVKRQGGAGVDVAGTNGNANAKPKEKLKARMRMREKPGPSAATGSGSAPPAAAIVSAVVPAAGRRSGMGESVGGAGRVTRSTSLKRKERGGGSGSDRGRSRAEVKRIKKDGGGSSVGNSGSARINEGVLVAATSATAASGIDAAPQAPTTVASCSTSETLLPATCPTPPPPDTPTTPASTSDVIMPPPTEVVTSPNTTMVAGIQEDAPGTEPETETIVLGESSTVQKDAPADGGAGSGASTGLGSTTKMRMRTRPKPTPPTKQSSPTKPKPAPRPTTASTSTSTSTVTTTTKKSHPIFLAPPKSRPSSPTKPALVRSYSESHAAPPPPWGRPPPSAPASGSSLSTLANALEKLRMPPPMRPNTSMGTRDGDGDGASGSGAVDGDGEGLGRSQKSAIATTPARTNVAAKSPAVKRPFVVSRAKARVSLGRSSIGKARIGLGLGMSSGSGMRMGGGASTSTRTGMTPTRTPPRPRVGVTTPTRGRVFRVGAFGGVGRGRGVMKASRKTSLPSVMASPVKGGGGDDSGDGDKVEIVEEGVVGQGRDGEMGKRDGDGDVFMDGGDGPSGVEVANTENGEVTRKGKEKEKGGSRPVDAWKMNASRRASMASRALSMSLSSLPPAPPPNGAGTNGVGLMGPPATPVGRSTSSTYPTSTLSVGRSRVVGKSGMTLRTRTVAGAGQSAPAALGKVRGGVGGHVSSSRKGAGEKSKSKGEGVGCVLEDCRIFVDVRTDDGDDAGALFVDMLKGMGAKIMTRVGPTCTHIVYKNGLMSTLTRYRLLNAPRPAVVGIAWVVECVEQKRVVEVEKFTIDLEGVNVAGANKRRRSMLPKQIVMAEGWGEDVPGSVDGDRSMEGSVTMISSDDDLPPLEKARRRQSMMLFNGAGSVKG